MISSYTEHTVVSIKFGMWSTILLLGSAHGMVMSALLLRARRNRLANRFLAVLLVAVVLRITPYTIGYAGFYDAYPWLSFAPLDWRMAFGPLLYFYVRQLFVPQLPPRWGWHFALAAVQGGYYTVSFCMPLEWKNSWDARIHVPWVVPLETWAGYASMLAYGLTSYRMYHRSQRWLEDNSAAREEYRLTFLRGFLFALAAMVGLDLSFDIVALSGVNLNYFDRFPLYLAFTALVYYLGLEGWRHSDRLFPSMTIDATPLSAVEVEASEVTPTPGVAPPNPNAISGQPSSSIAADPEHLTEHLTDLASLRDWHEIGSRWAAKVTSEQWWREPALSLTDLARRLGTNTRYLSRAFNEGLGISFSEFINRQRIDEAKRRLAEEGDSLTILAIALEVGFASKASFNRAFKVYAECTPSEYRAAAPVRSNS